MNSREKTAGTLPDVRIILGALWGAGMLSSLNGDTYRLSNPEMLKTMLANTASIKTTPELLLIMSLVFVVPVFMCIVSLVLKRSTSRKANRIIGIIYAVIIFGFWILNFVIKSNGYEFVWSTAQLAFASMVVWFAWKRPEQNEI